MSADTVSSRSLISEERIAELADLVGGEGDDEPIRKSIRQAIRETAEECAKLCEQNEAGYDYKARNFKLLPATNIGRHNGICYAAAIRERVTPPNQAEGTAAAR